LKAIIFRSLLRQFVAGKAGRASIGMSVGAILWPIGAPVKEGAQTNKSVVGLRRAVAGLGSDPLSPLSARIRKDLMPDGLLDRQSLLYQFMPQLPILAGGKPWLSDGVKQSQFSYRMAGFDSLPITAPGGETIALWLVPEMHYLPVKVRYADLRVAAVEPLAVSLDFSE